MARRPTSCSASLPSRCSLGRSTATRWPGERALGATVGSLHRAPMQRDTTRPHDAVQRTRFGCRPHRRTHPCPQAPAPGSSWMLRSLLA
jgi:hypothetical protein